MDMTGEQKIAAPRATVWQALNDPEVLKACIPGCTALDKLSDTEMKAAATLAVGPVKANFTGNVTLSEIDAPNSYVITGQGSGGIAGFAKGSAKVTLATYNLSDRNPALAAVDQRLTDSLRAHWSLLRPAG